MMRPWYGVMGYPPGMAEEHPPECLGGFRTRADAEKVKAEAEASGEYAWVEVVREEGEGQLR